MWNLLQKRVQLALVWEFYSLNKLLLHLMNIKYTDSIKFWTDLYFSDFQTTLTGYSHCSDCNRCVAVNVSTVFIPFLYLQLFKMLLCCLYHHRCRLSQRLSPAALYPSLCAGMWSVWYASGLAVVSSLRQGDGGGR